MKEEIVIKTVKITRTGELNHFEIPLPKNTVEITALWYKIRLLNLPGVVKTVIKGKSVFNPMLVTSILSLSSYGREGIFYYGYLFLEKRNVGFLDFTSEIFPVEQYNRAPFQKKLSVKIDGKTSIVNGGLLDNWGIVNNADVNYEVDIYLTVKLKEDDTATGC